MLLAHGNPDIELLAVTTVVGNQTLPKVTRNALAVARIAGITGRPVRRRRRPPAASARSRSPRTSTARAAWTAPMLPEPPFELDPRHAVDLIIDTSWRTSPAPSPWCRPAA